MTKHYCDRCENEAGEDKHVRIMITGVVLSRYYSKFIHLCEDCFKKYESKVSKFIPIKSGAAAV